MRVAGGLDERAPVLRVGDVAGDRDDAGEAARPRGVERVGVARVDDDAPAALGERAGEREAEAARGPGDDCRSACLARYGRRRSQPPAAIGPRTC